MAHLLSTFVATLSTTDGNRSVTVDHVYGRPLGSLTWLPICRPGSTIGRLRADLDWHWTLGSSFVARWLIIGASLSAVLARLTSLSDAVAYMVLRADN